MLKQSLIYLSLTIIVVIFARFFHQILTYVDFFYNYLYTLIFPIFNPDYRGKLVIRIILYSLIPLILTGIPALIYHSIKGRLMPYFYEIMWTIWLIVILSNLLI